MRIIIEAYENSKEAGVAQSDDLKVLQMFLRMFLRDGFRFEKIEVSREPTLNNSDFDIVITMNKVG
jgi:hypothetical protein